MRLIDADFLQLRVNLKGTNKFGMLDENIRDFIDTAPTVDAELVVRCKDCKHRVYKYANEEIGEIGGCGLFNRAMSNNDFCSYGERKESDDQ